MDIPKILKKRKNKDFSKGEWTHRAHLVVGRSYVVQYIYEESLCFLKAKIILLNDLRGLENTPESGYHETLTQFRLKKLYLRKEATGKTELRDIEEFLLTEQATSTSMYEYREKEEIFSTRARAVRVEPTLKSL